MLSYNDYLRLRGYSAPIVNPGPFFWRSLIACWAAPGMHKFWRLWNPPVGYLTYLLYRLMGGKRNRVVATITAFVVCGYVIHDLVGLVFFDTVTFRNTIAFFLFALFTLLSRALENALRQDQWRAVLNIMVNAGIVSGSFWLGTLINGLLLGDLGR